MPHRHGTAPAFAGAVPVRAIWSKTTRYRLARTSRIRIRISAPGGGFCSPASSSGRVPQHAYCFARGTRSTESKGFNTEKQARTTESTEQKRIWALRAVRGRAPTRSVIIPVSVDSVVLACFSVLEPLLSGCDTDPDGRQCPSRPAGGHGPKRNCRMPNRAKHRAANPGLLARLRCVTLVGLDPRSPSGCTAPNYPGLLVRQMLGPGPSMTLRERA
jgi:hypothetical protein